MDLHGVGPRTLKALAMASEVVHGDATRFDDPARFSFAVGGKDGRPHPIDTESFDETVAMLQDSVDKAVPLFLALKAGTEVVDLLTDYTGGECPISKEDQEILDQKAKLEKATKYLTDDGLCAKHSETS